MASSLEPYLLFFTTFISSFIILMSKEFLRFTVDLKYHESLKYRFFDNTTTPNQKFYNDIHHFNVKGNRTPSQTLKIKIMIQSLCCIIQKENTYDMQLAYQETKHLPRLTLEVV